ncbi:hypothetical protein EON64_03595 [archaeon]|nr:MAG: hypothetical protein EON64_03595 [archaeon]
MSGGVLANILLSIALNANIALTSGIPFPVFSDGLVVTALSSPSALSPARQAGLAANDVLLRVNGEKIPRGLDSVSDFVATIRRNENAAVRLTVRQGGEAGMEKEVVVTPRSEGGRASIGIGIAPRIVDVNIRKAQSPVEVGMLYALAICGALYSFYILCLSVFLQALLIGVDQTSRLVSLTGSSVVKGIRTG